MNRAQVVAEYLIPKVKYSDFFLEMARALRILIQNKDRAYGRLISGEKATNRRRIEKPAGASPPSFET